MDITIPDASLFEARRLATSTKGLVSSEERTLGPVPSTIPEPVEQVPLHFKTFDLGQDEQVDLSKINIFSKSENLVDDWNCFVLAHTTGSPCMAILPNGQSISLPISVKYNMIKYKSPFETNTSKGMTDHADKCYRLFLEIPVSLELSDYIFFFFILSLNQREPVYEKMSFNSLTNLMFLANAYAPGFLPDLLQAVWINIPRMEICALIGNPHLDLIEMSEGTSFSRNISRFVGLVYLGLSFGIKDTLRDILGGASGGDEFMHKVAVILQRIIYHYPDTVYHINLNICIDLEILSKFVLQDVRKQYKYKQIFKAWEEHDTKKLNKIQREHLHLDIETTSADGQKIIRISRVASKMGYNFSQEELKECGLKVVEEFRSVVGYTPIKINIDLKEKEEVVNIYKYSRSDYDIIKIGIKKYLLAKRFETWHK